MDSVQHYINEGILYEPIIGHPTMAHRSTVPKETDFCSRGIDYALEQLQQGQPELQADLVARTMFLERAHG